MKICKTCIHYDACRMFIDVDRMESKCKNFEDKCLYIKQPCAIGDTVYLLRRMTEKECISSGIVSGVYCVGNKQRQYTDYKDRPYKIVKTVMKQSYYKLFGYMVFLDLVAAELKLKKLNK